MNEGYKTIESIQLDNRLFQNTGRNKRHNRNLIGDLLWFIVGLSGVPIFTYATNHLEDDIPHYIKYENK